MTNSLFIIKRIRVPIYSTLWYEPYHRVVGTKSPGLQTQKAVQFLSDELHSLLYSAGLKFLRTYFFFFQSLVISSSVLPFVSGTSFHTKRAAATQIIP